MNIDKKTIIQTILFAIIGIGLVYWRFNTLSENDKNAMMDAFVSIKWRWLIPIGLVGFFSHYIRAVRWQMQFKAVNMPYNTFYTFSAVMLGYLTNIFIPRLGEVSKCSAIVKYNGGNVDKVIGTAIAERIWDTICFTILTLLTLILQLNILLPYAKEIANKITSELYNNKGEINIIKIGIAIAALIVLIIGAIILYNKTRHTKIGKFINGIKTGLQSIILIKEKGVYLLYTLLLWGAYTAIAIMIFKAIPATEHLPLIAGLTIITFGTFAMIVPAPGAIAYPIIVAPILQLYGTSAGVGQGYGWINWANQNLVVIFLGVAVMILLPIYKNRKHVK
jgi:uncharacterized protein (TIRG00374 family)